MDIIGKPLTKENMMKLIKGFSNYFHIPYKIGLHLSSSSGYDLGIAPALYVSNFKLYHGELGIINIRLDGRYDLIFIHELSHVLNHWFNYCGIMDRNKGHDINYWNCHKMVENWYYRMVMRGEYNE